MGEAQQHHKLVMAGFVPAIHELASGTAETRHARHFGRA
jgi:hypothetical protein